MPSFTWSQDRIDAFEAALAKRPHVSRVNHVSICVDDLRKAEAFYAHVLGGRIISEGSPHFTEVVVGGTIIGISDNRGAARRSADEFPHIAFEIDSDQFLPMKAWLEANGVKTHEPWTRFRIEGLMYFKDPAGNLLELYCPEFAGADRLRQTRSVNDVVDLANLDYEWEPSRATPVLA
jgi:catechol 2,3-dioxygenase-like lactoylglutathione lyase family enzyme